MGKWPWSHFWTWNTLIERQFSQEQEHNSHLNLSPNSMHLIVVTFLLCKQQQWERFQIRHMEIVCFLSLLPIIYCALLECVSLYLSQIWMDFASIWVI